MKRDLTIFIISGIIFSIITGSVVAYSYNAKDISYTPSNNSYVSGIVLSSIKLD